MAATDERHSHEVLSDVKSDEVPVFVQRELRQSVEEATRFLDQNGPQNWREKATKPVDNWSPATNVLLQIFNEREFSGLVDEFGIYADPQLDRAFGYSILTKESERFFVNVLWNKFLGFDS